MDHHAVAAVSVIGICLDVLGGLYLAYDLLGGQHGPLRLLTRIVTYSVVFGIGYGIGLGLFFGLAAGAATGFTIALELHRTAGTHDHYSLPWEAAFSAIRGFGFGAGLYRILGLAVRNHICRSHHRRAGIRLYPRHAAQSRLCGVSPDAYDAPAIVGSYHPHSRVHRNGSYL
jgi:hypothetical protein